MGKTMASGILRVQRLKKPLRTPRLRPRHIRQAHKVRILADRLKVLEGRVDAARSAFEEARAEAKTRSFMGFSFVLSERLPITGTDREIPCWVPSGMHLGMWNDITTRISERDDKSYSTQVYVKGTFGATRVEEEKVVEILCDL